MQIPDTVRDKISWFDVKELDERGEDLSEWEIEFVDSLLKQLKMGRFLTEKQRQRLDEIREEKLE